MYYASFIEDVRDHKMTICMDQGNLRHLFFSKGSIHQHFTLTTWPGHLCIAGDMGTFVFSRLSDMFEFHRPGSMERRDQIDFSYWAEKCQSQDPQRSIWEFSEDRYMEAIRSDVNAFLEGSVFTLQERKIIVSDAQETLFRFYHDEREALDVAMGWRCPVSGDHPFFDFYEHRLKEISPSFKWCCHAIRWGIRKYDQHHNKATQADHDSLVLSGVI